jgi:hypothetical protein
MMTTTDWKAVKCRTRAIDCPWVTAKIIEPNRAHRFVNRLDVLGFDYQVVQENRHLRILVRRQTLDEVLDWFEELSCSRQEPPIARRIANRVGVRLLVAIPSGILCGAVVSHCLGIANPASYAVSGYFGLAAIALALGIGSRISRNDRR